MSSFQTFGRGRRQPVYGLDLVRFVAAGLVVAYHLGFKAWALDSSSLHGALGASSKFPAGYGWTWCGWIGVQVFFVVSGAVIAYSADGATPLGFARRRVARLLPAVLISVVLALPIAMTLLDVPPVDAVILAFKTVAFVPWGPWIVGQFWTIPIELAFYAVICAILASSAPAAAIRALAWVLGLAAAGYWLAVTAGWPFPGGRLSQLLLLQHGAYFALGMLCARIGQGNLRPGHLALVAACMAAAAIQVRSAAAWEMLQRPDLARHWPFAYGIWAMLTAMVALAFRWREAIADRAGRFGNVLRLAGLSTYPLYLIHIHVGGAILVATAGLGMLAASICAFAGSLAAAIVIARWVEPRVHAALDAGLRRVGEVVLQRARAG